MTASLTAESSGRLSAKDRILLVNPPVEETRYSWIRWNQPLDLLKIASFLGWNWGAAWTLRLHEAGEIRECARAAASRCQTISRR